MMKGLTMIDNIDIAYCMAQLEDRIRREWISAKNCLDYCDGVEDPLYEKIIDRWSTMIDSFEAAFGVGYF